MLVMVDMIFWMQPELDKIKKAWENIQRINWNIQTLLSYDLENYKEEKPEYSN